MSRRRRGVGFLLLALGAAPVAATIATGYAASVSRGYGPLRPVVVTVAPLPAKRPIDTATATADLAVRRVPSSFVPPGALGTPAQAVGLVPAAPLPAGSYLLAAQLHPPPGPQAEQGPLGPGRHPVEILVSGVEALLAAGPLRSRSRVDVVVTTEPSGAGPGRTYVAASAVPLLALSPAVEESGPGAAGGATLALTRRQALRLIAAESFARRLTLLPRGR